MELFFRVIPLMKNIPTVKILHSLFLCVQQVKEEVLFQTERENHLQVEYSELMQTRSMVLQMIKTYETDKGNV